ncbi:MAG: hypothetical protein Q7S36_01870 [Candidatus Liptonbacteria bacterium]|nr:hypothetical protein [Candidatus Liptonbacteria bacterium]
MNKVIGLDLDGVIIDHSELKVKLAKKHGVDITLKETPSEIMWTFFPEETWREIQTGLYGGSELSMKAPLMPGALTGIEVIKAGGNPYFLVTRRRNMDIIVEVLRTGNLWPKFFNEKNVFAAQNLEDKEIISKKLGITAYADDERRVLKSLLSVPDKILFDPFGVFDDSEFVNVGSWVELTKRLI